MQRQQHVARGVPVVAGVKRARDNGGSTCVDREERGGGEIESGQCSVIRRRTTTETTTETKRVVEEEYETIRASSAGEQPEQRPEQPQRPEQHVYEQQQQPEPSPPSLTRRSCVEMKATAHLLEALHPDLDGRQLLH
eukprot:1343310-Prymnesium_polylepis.1